MPRDYARSRSHQQSRNASSGIIWLLMGILIGLIIAGIFYVKNQHHAKSAVLNSPSETIPKTSPDNAPVTQVVKNPAKPAASQNLQTQFDFYNVLPSKKVIGPSGDEDTSELQNNPNKQTTQNTSNSQNTPNQPQNTTAAAPPSTELPPPSKPLPPVIQAAPAAKTKSMPPASAASKSGAYIVQVAALSEASDADQLKAQLTLLGFDVKVSTSAPKNGKTYHRVWLGAFHTLSEAESIQKRLQENMISSKVLKSAS